MEVICLSRLSSKIITKQETFHFVTLLFGLLQTNKVNIRKSDVTRSIICNGPEEKSTFLGLISNFRVFQKFPKKSHLSKNVLFGKPKRAWTCTTQGRHSRWGYQWPSPFGPSCALNGIKQPPNSVLLGLALCTLPCPSTLKRYLCRIVTFRHFLSAKKKNPVVQ